MTPQAALHLLCGDEATRLWADLAARYSEPHRQYHDLTHVGAVLAAVERLRPDPPGALVFAALYHDAVYDSRAKDNEAKSADLAAQALASVGIDAATRDEVRRLILLTHKHETTPDDTSGHVLLDADLAILGASPDEYDRYAAAIRREYAWVPEDDYRTGRAAVLGRFLARPRLYFTDVFFSSHEARARENLAREVARLRG